MQAVRVCIGAVAASVVVAGGVAGPASATNWGVELNGRFLVTSNGDWAKTNEVFHDEKTKRQVWTVTSVCESPAYCTGHIVSSEGWETDGHYTADRWVVRRTVPNWAPCYDGTFASGMEEFRFWPVDANGLRYTTDGSTFGGVDNTRTVSGACGRNNPLIIELPLRLQRIID